MAASHREVHSHTKGEHNVDLQTNNKASRGNSRGHSGRLWGFHRADCIGTGRGHELCHLAETLLHVHRYQ